MATKERAAPKLRGVEPEYVKRHLKMLLYGKGGVGKTTLALSFQRPYLIDLEAGAQQRAYVERLKAMKGAYWACSNPDELIDELHTLAATQHPYRAVIIDPITSAWERWLDAGIEREGGDEYGRHKKHAIRPIKQLYHIITTMRCNVIMTAHAKDQWKSARDAKGREVSVREGETFDGHEKLEYLFDLVLRMSVVGKQSVCYVVKSRIDEFERGSTFPATYEEFERRVGKDVLEGEAGVVKWATPEQIAEFEELIKMRTDKDDIRSKLLDKQGIDCWERVEYDKMAAYIEHAKKGGK